MIPTDRTEWGAFARQLSARARASRMSRLAVARRLAREAGLDSGAPFHSAHNALVGAAHGRPWPGVDYSIARKLGRLHREGWLFEAERLADSIIARSMPR